MTLMYFNFLKIWNARYFYNYFYSYTFSFLILDDGKYIHFIFAYHSLFLLKFSRDTCENINGRIRFLVVTIKFNIYMVIADA